MGEEPPNRIRSLSNSSSPNGKKSRVGVLKGIPEHEIETIDASNVTVSASLKVSTPHLAEPLSRFKHFPKDFSSHKSLELVSKLQDSLKETAAAIHLKQLADGSKKWYHRGLKYHGRRKMVNTFLLNFRNRVLEAKYLEEDYSRNIKKLRIMSSVCLALELLYGVADCVYATEDVKILAVMRYCIFFPLMALMLGLMWTKWFPKHQRLYTIIYCFIFGLSFASAGATVSTSFSMFYYQSMLWPIAFAYLLLGVPSLYSLGLSAALVLTLLHDISAMWNLLHKHNLLAQIFYFTFFSYIFESQRRKEFLVRRLVVKQQSILKNEKEVSEGLLLNILPKPIAERVKIKEVVADRFAMCTVMFGKLVDIELGGPTNTPRGPATLTTSSSHANHTTSLVDTFMLLNNIFTVFDNRLQFYPLEKIKHVGQTYMVVGGVPVPREDHCDAVAEFALDLLELVRKYNNLHGTSVGLRIGIHSGPVVAGVIGNLKMIYDLWGDTCNVASRMESTAEKGHIQLTEKSKEMLKSKFSFVSRGEVVIKGKGKMNTYFLNGRISKREDPMQVTDTVVVRSRPSTANQSRPISAFGKVHRNSVSGITKGPSSLSLHSLTKIQQMESDVSCWDFLHHILYNDLLNRFTLHFMDSNIESEFKKHYAKKSRKIVGAAMLLVLLFHIASIGLDVMFVITKDQLQTYLILKGIIILAYTGFIVVVYQIGSLYMKAMQQFGFASALDLTDSNSAAMLVGPAFYWLLSSSLFFIFLFTKLKFVVAAPLGLATFVLFKVVTNLPGQHSLDSTSNVIATCMFASLCIVLMIAHYLVENLERRDFYMKQQATIQQQKIKEEKEKSEELLLNILPKTIVETLKHSKVLPEEFSDVTCLCADIVGFTDFCSQRSPATVVSLLGQLFSIFDQLIPKHNVEKIKTVGDAYLVACGVPYRVEHHARNVAEFAIDMLESVKAFNLQSGENIMIRIGIHSGSCVGGLMGAKRFTYDIIGEAISISNLTESNGSPGKIHVTEAVKTHLQSYNGFVFEEREELMDCGKRGKFQTFFLSKPSTTTNPASPTNMQNNSAQSIRCDSVERMSSNTSLVEENIDESPNVT